MRYRPEPSESVLLILGFVTLVCLVIFFTRPPFFDEDDYLSNVGIIQQYGLTDKYLLHLVGSAGPLYSVIHYICKPITHLEVPYIRFINLFFLTGVTFFTSRILQLLEASRYYALYVMAIPMTYVTGGLALTEMPALFFFTLAIYFVIKTTSGDASTHPLLNLIIGGLCMSLAIIGRQPYLLTLAAFPVLFIDKVNSREKLLQLAVFIICSIMLPCYIFYVWKGFVAPADALLYAKIAQEGTSLRLDFVFYCLAYFSVAMFLITAELYKKLTANKWLTLFLLYGVLTVINLKLELIMFLPSRSLMQDIVEMPLLINFLESFFGVGIIFSSVYFLVVISKRFFEMGYKKEMLFFLLIILLIAAACAKITWGFSSRYAAQAIPALVLLGSFFYKNSTYNVPKIIVGVAAGLVSIIFYFISE